MLSPNSSQAALAAILPVRIARALNVRISAGPTEHPLEHGAHRQLPRDIARQPDLAFRPDNSGGLGTRGRDGCDQRSTNQQGEKNTASHRSTPLVGRYEVRYTGRSTLQTAKGFATAAAPNLPPVANN